MLSQAQAQELVFARLHSRFESAQFSIARDAVMERSFGWVFLIHAVQSVAGDVPDVKLPRAVIVNKYSEQIIASSMDHEAERLIRMYEKLLAENQASTDNWCRTVEVRWPWRSWMKRTVGERAKEAGFYEIGGQGKNS